MTASPTPTTLETEETVETHWIIQHQSLDYWASSAPLNSFDEAWDALLVERKDFPSLTFRIVKRTIHKTIEVLYK